MAPAIPHLLAFYSPQKDGIENRQSMASRNGSGLQLGPTIFEVRQIQDEEELDEEFSVFYCSCGKACKVMEFLVPDSDTIQNFLSNIKECQCELTPNQIRYISAPLNVSKVSLSVAGTNTIPQSTSDSYSEIESTDNGFYDMARKRLNMGEVSQGYTVKLYPIKRPVIYFWSKAPGRQDIIRDVTYSATRHRTKLPVLFTFRALKSLIGKSQIGELLDWEPTVIKYLNSVRNVVYPTDLLYFLTCPFILRFSSLASGFISARSSIDVWTPLLNVLSVRGTEIRNPEQFYQQVLPPHLQQSVQILAGITSQGSFYIPSLIMLSEHFIDQFCFNQLCRNLTLIGSDFMKSLMEVGPGRSPEINSLTIKLIASKVSQRALTDIISSCMTATGCVAFRELSDSVNQAHNSDTMSSALDEMQSSSAKTISKFLCDVQGRLIDISINRS
jgi:hypothetical protein